MPQWEADGVEEPGHNDRPSGRGIDGALLRSRSEPTERDRMRLTLLACLIIATANELSGGEADLELLLEVRPGRGDKPMVVVWVEDGQGKFVETLEICSQAVKYYPELKHWRAAQNGKATQELDAIMGATIRWGGKRLIEIPTKSGRGLLDGNHVLCIESAADKGARFGILKIPLAKDFKVTMVEHEGYVARATVRLAGTTDDTSPSTQPAAASTPSPPNQKATQQP
jgi:hypothetical protein